MRDRSSTTRPADVLITPAMLHGDSDVIAAEWDLLEFPADGVTPLQFAEEEWFRPDEHLWALLSQKVLGDGLYEMVEHFIGRARVATTGSVKAGIDKAGRVGAERAIARAERLVAESRVDSQTNMYGRTRYDYCAICAASSAARAFACATKGRSGFEYGDAFNAEQAEQVRLIIQALKTNTDEG